MKQLVAFWLSFLINCSIHAQPKDSVLSEVAVLTIHVSDTNTHEAVFQFLKDLLKLPVEYGPEMVGQRRYGAVYAGNLFIEPCGPYTNMRYPVKDFKALFFGLNCRSDHSPASITEHLDRLKIHYQKESATVFRIQEPAIADGIYFAIDSRNRNKADEGKEAAFRSAVAASNRDGLGLSGWRI